MKYFLLTILCGLVSSSFSQKLQKEYLNRDMEIVKKKKDAAYYRKISYDSEGNPTGLVRWYWKDGTMYGAGYLDSENYLIDTFRIYFPSGNVGCIQVFEDRQLQFQECYSEGGIPYNYCKPKRDSLELLYAFKTFGYQEVIQELMLGNPIPSGIDKEEILYILLISQDKSINIFPDFAIQFSPPIVQLYFEMGMYKEAIDFLGKTNRRLMIREPGMKEIGLAIQMAEAGMQLRLGNIDQAKDKLQVIRSESGTDLSPLVSLSLGFLEARIDEIERNFPSALNKLKGLRDKISDKGKGLEVLPALSIYYSLGSVNARIHEYDSAEKYLREGISMAQDLANPHFITTQQISLGAVLFRQGRTQEAFAQITEAYQEAIAFSLWHPASEAANNLSVFYNEMGNLDSTEFWATRLEKILDSVPIASSSSLQSTSTVSNWVRQGKPTELLDEIRKFRMKAEEANNAYLSASYLNLESWANLELGNYGTADSLLEKALAMSEGLNMPDMQISILNNRGASLFRRGYFEETIPYLLRSTQLSREVPPTNASLQGLRSLAFIHDILGDSIEAWNYSLLIDSLSASYNLYGLNAEAKNNLGVISSRKGDDQLAATYFKKALETGERLGRPKVWANTHLRWGQELIRHKEYDSAEVHLKESLQYFSKNNDKYQEAESSIYLAISLWSRGETEIAEEMFLNNLRYYQDNGFLSYQATILTVLASIQLQEGNLEKADSLLNESIEVTEEGIKMHRGELGRLRQFDQNSKAFPLAIELAARKDNAMRVFDLSERRRTRVLNDLLGKRIDQIEGVQPDLLTEYDSIKTAYQSLDKRLQRTPYNSKKYQEILTEKKECLLAYKSTESRIRSENPAIYKNSAPFRIRDVQSTIPIDEAWISIVQGRNWEAVIATRDSVHLVRLGDRSELDQLFAGYQSQFIEPMEKYLQKGDILAKGRADKAFPKLSARLYHKIWTPLLQSGLIADKRLLVAADSIANLFPFSVLQPDSVQKPYQEYQYVARRTNIRYTPSFSIETQLPSEPETYQKEFAGFFPETFGTKGYRKFTPLEGGATLANTIEEHLVGKQADFFFNQDCTEEKIKHKDLTGTRILHFHSHTVTNRSGQSYIALPNGEDSYNRLDQVEIMGMKLNAELVILGSCGSGVGAYKAGEGNMGFARGFLGAGAKALITSLSTVDEAATVSFFGRYYQSLASSPYSNGKDILLNDVQREMINDPRTANPYHWGSFVYVGKP